MSLRPSGLLRCARCPGSVREEAKIPVQDEVVNEHAERGKHLHELVGSGILKPLDRLMFLEECETEEDAIALQGAWKAAELAWDSLTPEQRAKATVLIEQEVDLTCLSMGKGTPDFVIAIKDEGIILLDWKFGGSYVTPASENLQVAAYAYAVMNNLGIVGDAKIGIYQPEVSPDVDYWTATPEDIAAIEPKIKHIAEQCSKPDAPLIPGTHCRWCLAKYKCEPRLLVAAEVRQIADPVAVIKAMLPEQRKDLYERLSHAIGMLEKAKESIDAGILDASIAVPGYGPGQGKKGRFWKDEKDVAITQLQNLASEKGISVLDVIEPLSVSKAEKLLGKASVAGMFAEVAGNPTVKRVK